MKKIKAFFTGLKARFRKWWTSTLIPVKRVVMLCSLLSLVAFGVGSCSSKNSFETASAASPDSFIVITSNYQPQLYIQNGDMSITKILPDFTFRIADDKLYYIRDDVLYDITSSSSVTVPCYYYYENGTSFSYGGTFLDASSTFFNTSALSLLLSGDLTLENIKATSRVSSSYNYVRYYFYSNGSLIFYVNLARTPLPASSLAFNLTWNSDSVPWYKFNVTYGDNNNQSYILGYNYGYEQGYQKGVSASLSDISPWDVLVNGLDSFFNIKLFGSISIGTIFKIGVSTLLIGFIIKIFLGG